MENMSVYSIVVYYVNGGSVGILPVRKIETS